jgi:tetratricopeptide (TPR) repeat protein
MIYSAFVSYSSKDLRWARWLQKALEQFKLPKEMPADHPLRREGQNRLKPVFRDRDEMSASADLGQQINAGLAQSHFLIVICSPASAGSRWVDAEVREFQRLGRQTQILCIIVDGEPGSDDPVLRCFPPSLFTDDGVEPLAADVRQDRDGKQAAVLKLLATMLDVRYDDLRQRDQAHRLRRLAMISTGSVIGFAIALGLALIAFIARNEAIEQRDIARTRTLTAERSVDFIKGLFAVADPSTAQGAKMTPKDIVDRGASSFRAALENEPKVQAEIAMTLSEVYGTLGLYQQSDELIRSVSNFDFQDDLIDARRFVLQGESQFRLADYNKAIVSFEKAIARLASEKQSNSILLTRAQVGLGQSLSATDEFEKAEKILKQALVTDTQRGPSGLRDKARDMEALGNNELLGGDLEVARKYFQASTAIVIGIEGENSPTISDNYDRLASISYFLGDSEQAERLFRKRLAIDEKVLGPDHPDVATTLNNLARILLERRRYSEAKSLLKRSARISLAEKGALHDDVAFILNNLGLAYAHTNNFADAEQAYITALAAADKQDSRMLGPIKSNLVSLYCANDKIDAAKQLLVSARKNLLEDYPDDQWRVAILDIAWAECEWKRGNRDVAVKLLASSKRQVYDRWNANTMFGDDARKIINKYSI